MGALMMPVAATYEPRDPSRTVLYKVIAGSGYERAALLPSAHAVAEGERPAFKGPRCASVNGFSLPTNTEMPAHRRGQLER